MDANVYDSAEQSANSLLVKTMGGGKGGNFVRESCYGAWIFSLFSPQCEGQSLTFTEMFEIARETNTEHEGFTSEYCAAK